MFIKRFRAEDYSIRNVDDGEIDFRLKSDEAEMYMIIDEDELEVIYNTIGKLLNK
jgi:hypothetical protein